MQLEAYDLIIGSNSTKFEFWSEGPNGRILKIIHFQSTKFPHVFNLAFGDMNYKTGQMNDSIITNNGDTEKVLATVVSAIYQFTDSFQNAWVYATGSTPARTRLYQMSINKYFDIAIRDFKIVGETDEEWEYFEKGKNYQAIAVQRKIV